MRLFLATLIIMLMVFGTANRLAFAQEEELVQEEEKEEKKSRKEKKQEKQAQAEQATYLSNVVTASFAQDLTQAAHNGNVALVTELIKNGASLAFPDANGRYPLHAAAANAHVGVIEVMLASSGNIINIPDAQGYTPLHLAVANRHLAAVQLLADKGANLNFPLPNRQTPLHTALKNNYIPIVNLLIERRALLSADEKRLTPLHYAVAGGYIDIAEDLVKRGSRVSSVDFRGNTPLHYAALSGQLDMTAFLLMNGADTARRNNAGQTPDMLATSNGFPRVLSLIRVYQADPLIDKVVFRTNVTPDYSGWRDLLPARAADGANQDAIGQIETMVGAVGERYLALTDVTVPELLPRPDLPNPLDVRQTLFESDFEFGSRAAREVGEYRGLFYEIQRDFEQNVEVRNARVSSLRQRVNLRRDNLNRLVSLFKRDSTYEVLRGFRLEDPQFDARTGDLTFLLSATGAIYQQRIAIRPLDRSIVEDLYNSPEIATLAVSLSIQDKYLILDEVFIEYDDENIFKAQAVQTDALGNPIERGKEVVINTADITNKVEDSLSDDTAFTFQDTELVADTTIATVRYSNNSDLPIKYVDNIGIALQSFVANNFSTQSPAKNGDILLDSDDDALEVIETEVIAAVTDSSVQETVLESPLESNLQSNVSFNEEDALEALETEILSSAANEFGAKLPLEDRSLFDEEDALEAIETEILASSAQR